MVVDEVVDPVVPVVSVLLALFQQQRMLICLLEATLASNTGASAPMGRDTGRARCNVDGLLPL